MEIRKTSIDGLYVLQANPHSDERGVFVDIFDKDKLTALGIDHDFVQDSISGCTNKGTVRGLHFQTEPFAQNKLLRCVRGSLFDVAVDLRKSSPSYLKKFSIDLKEDDWQLVFLPAGVAHGFCTLENNSQLSYKIAGAYSPEHAQGLYWQDPQFEIDWPVDPARAILSDKDQTAANFDASITYFT